MSKPATEAKEGDLVRIVRAHSEGVDRLIGKVETVRKYGGHLRYTIRLSNGSILDLDARTISQLDIVTALSLLDPEFKAGLDGTPKPWRAP